LLADTAGISPSKLDETLFSPGGGPGVLDVPVRSLDVTDSQDAVVELSSAVGEDTRLIVRPGGGINTDGDGLGSDCSLESSAVSGGDDGIGGQSSSGGFAVSLVVAVTGSGEFSGSTGVGILSIGTEGVGLDVFVSINGPSSIASLVSISAGAGNNLLFGVVGNGSNTGHGVGRIEGFGGRESPARSALTLVENLDGVTLLDPVDGGWEGNVGVIDHFFVSFVFGEGDVHEVGGLEFFLGEVSEMVHSEGVGVTLVFSDPSEVGSPDSESVHFLFLVVVVLSVFDLPFSPLFDEVRCAIVMAGFGLVHHHHGGGGQKDGGSDGEKKFLHFE